MFSSSSSFKFIKLFPDKHLVFRFPQLLPRLVPSGRRPPLKMEAQSWRSRGQTSLWRDPGFLWDLQLVSSCRWRGRSSRRDTAAPPSPGPAGRPGRAEDRGPSAPGWTLRSHQAPDVSVTLGRPRLSSMSTPGTEDVRTSVRFTSCFTSLYLKLWCTWWCLNPDTSMTSSPSSAVRGSISTVISLPAGGSRRSRRTEL